MSLYWLSPLNFEMPSKGCGVSKKSIHDWVALVVFFRLTRTVGVVRFHHKQWDRVMTQISWQQSLINCGYKICPTFVYNDCFCGWHNVGWRPRRYCLWLLFIISLWLWSWQLLTASYRLGFRWVTTCVTDHLCLLIWLWSWQLCWRPIMSGPLSTSIIGNIVPQGW